MVTKHPSVPRVNRLSITPPEARCHALEAAAVQRSKTIILQRPAIPRAFVEGIQPEPLLACACCNTKT
jgi:hypothetical protein